MRDQPIWRHREGAGWILLALAVGVVLYPLFSGALNALGGLPPPRVPGLSEGVLRYNSAVAWAVFAFVWWCLRRGGSSLRVVGFPLRWRWWQLALVAGAVGLVLLSALDASSSGAEPLPGAPAFGWTLPERVLSIFVGGLTAAVVEETLLRGLALTYLPALLGGRTWPAVAASGLLFVMAHGPSSAAILGFRLVIALVFSLLFLWRRSLRLPIFLHWLINASGPATAP